MKSNIKVLILSLFVLVFTSLLFTKFTIFNSNFLINLIDNSNYYELLENDLKSEMKEFMVSSNIDEKILDNIITKDNLKEETTTLINNYYSNIVVKVNKDKFKSNLSDEINKYLLENKLTINSQNNINIFIDKLSDIYESNMLPISKLNNIRNKFYKLNILVSILILGCIVILFICIKKKIKFDNSLLTTSFTYLFIYLYIIIKLDINNLIILNNSITMIVKNIINILLNYTLIISILYIILFIIHEVIKILKKCH